MPPEPEFSRPVDVSPSVAIEGAPVVIVAEPDERRRLARRFDLLALDRLSATLRLHRLAADDGETRGVRVAGEMAAEVVQACVVTLEPVRSSVAAPVAAEFVPASRIVDRQIVSFTPDDADPPEPLVGDRIDLGELLAQHLALALDPYPKAPGAVPVQDALPAEPGRSKRDAGPFEALRRLRDAAGAREPDRQGTAKSRGTGIAGGRDID